MKARLFVAGVGVLTMIGLVAPAATHAQAIFSDGCSCATPYATPYVNPLSYYPSSTVLPLAYPSAYPYANSFLPYSTLASPIIFGGRGFGGGFHRSGHFGGGHHWRR